MFFEMLMEAHQRGDLLCPWICRMRRHIRNPGTVRISEIWVNPDTRMQGVGRWLVGQACKGMNTCVADCPADLDSNTFWQHLGFRWHCARKLKSGRWIHTWVWKREESLFGSVTDTW